MFTDFFLNEFAKKLASIPVFQNNCRLQRNIQVDYNILSRAQPSVKTAVKRDK
jgi:hypothetical protein